MYQSIYTQIHYMANRNVGFKRSMTITIQEGIAENISIEGPGDVIIK